MKLPIFGDSEINERFEFIKALNIIRKLIGSDF